MFSYYGELCTEVYDLTKPVGHSLGGDIEFYLHRLSSCNGRILEATVGSGRMFVPLLQAGLIVDGVDYSPEMLATCRKRCEERGLHPDLYEGELQNLSLPHKYETIIVPAGSFLLLEKREDSLSALKCFYEHLIPGGRIMIDLLLPDPSDFEMGKIGTSTFAFPDGYAITMEGRLVEVDFFHQYMVSYLKYEKWQDGRLLQTELQRFAIRWYGIEEFRMVLENIGFSDIVVSADFQYGKTPSNSRQQFTFEAVRI